MYYVVQSWGPDEYRDAKILTRHQRPEDAYEEMGLLVELIQSSSAGFRTYYVVDEQRQPVPRPAWD